MTELRSTGGRPRTAAVFPVPHHAPARPPAFPPRPALTTDLAPPQQPSRPAGPVRAGLLSTLPWFAGLPAVLVGVAATAADGAGLRARLTEAVTAQDPSASAQLIASGVRAVLLIVLGVQLLLALLAVIGAALLLRRHARARWALVVTGLVTLPAAAFAQGLVSGGADVDRIAFLTQGGLAVVGLVAVLSRPTGRWVRSRGR